MRRNAMDSPLIPRSEMHISEGGVAPLVGRRRQKLAEKVSMRGMDLDTVKGRLFSERSRTRDGLHLHERQVRRPRRQPALERRPVQHRLQPVETHRRLYLRHVPTEVRAPCRCRRVPVCAVYQQHAERRSRRNQAPLLAPLSTEMGRPRDDVPAVLSSSTESINGDAHVRPGATRAASARSMASRNNYSARTIPPSTRMFWPVI